MPTTMMTDSAPTPAMEPALVAYYSDRPLMWRNVTLIGISNLGWSMVFGIISPLMSLRLLEKGIHEGLQATITSANQWLVAFLVMYFSWRSDHTVSRLGRRKPYLFISAPFIIASIFAFPFIELQASLVMLMLIQMLFMDMKASTFPLLSIDCVPRHLLARANSVFVILGGLMGFLSMRATAAILDLGEWVPYVGGAALMTLTTIIAFWIREPPIHHPASKPFRPWSTFEAGWSDRRLIWLMLGAALLGQFTGMLVIWGWMWAKSSLQLDRADIFIALSWCPLINMVLAFPIGWVIDRFGGLRVVVAFFILQATAFAWAMNVHDKFSFMILMMAMTVYQPLYAAVDIMIYKAADPKEIGSYTSSTAFLRNGLGAMTTLVSGWIIRLTGQNYEAAFVLGITASTLGMAFVLVYVWIVRRTRVSATISKAIKMEPTEPTAIPTWGPSPVVSLDSTQKA